MLRVGLTGGIGAGKSTVAAGLAERGAVVVDADALARAVLEPGTDGLAEIVAAFGSGVLAADGSLDRAMMGRIVFADDGARKKLNAIVHPRVAALAAEHMQDAPGDAIVVHDVPLLVENRLAADYDVVVVVEAPESIRLARLEARGLEPATARARMTAQASDAERREVADEVIVNTGDPDDLQRAVDELWSRLLDRQRRK